MCFSGCTGGLITAHDLLMQLTCAKMFEYFLLLAGHESGTGLHPEPQ